MEHLLCVDGIPNIFIFPELEFQLERPFYYERCLKKNINLTGMLSNVRSISASAYQHLVVTIQNQLHDKSNIYRGVDRLVPLTHFIFRFLEYILKIP